MEGEGGEIFPFRGKELPSAQHLGPTPKNEVWSKIGLVTLHIKQMNDFQISLILPSQLNYGYFNFIFFWLINKYSLFSFLILIVSFTIDFIFNIIIHIKCKARSTWWSIILLWLQLLSKKRQLIFILIIIGIFIKANKNNKFLIIIIIIIINVLFMMLDATRFYESGVFEIAL